MKKAKGKEEIIVNPADYDYMDAMPLVGWIWEFIRRNTHFKYVYSQVTNMSEDLRRKITWPLIGRYAAKCTEEGRSIAKKIFFLTMRL